MNLNKIHCGDSLELLKQMPDEFVDCVVTSPPYWSLRAYQTQPQIWDDDKNCEHEWFENVQRPRGGKGSKFANVGANKNDEANMRDSKTTTNFCVKCNAWRGELGLEPDFNLYISHLIQIFDEVKRVLKKEGICFVNIGDTYSGSSNGTNDYRIKASKSLSGKRFDYNMMFQGKQKKQYQVLPNKSLCMIPYRFAQRMCDELNFTLRNVIVWHKPNAMPSSVRDRFTVDFEPIFFFSKSKKYYFQRQFEPHKNESDVKYRQRIRLNKQYDTKEPYEKNTPYATNKINKEIRLSAQESPNRCFGDNKNLEKMLKQGRNKRTVWTIPTQPSSEEHFASYPENLVKIMIESGCPKNGIVLDPFCGIGTTCLTAKKLNRQYIGIDLNQKYVDICNRRFEQEIGFLV